MASSQSLSMIHRRMLLSPRRKRVVGERRVLGAAHDVVGGLALALEQQVGLADRVGLGVDLLTPEVRGNLLAPLFRETVQHVLRHGEHAAGPAGAVVEHVGGRLDPVRDGLEDEPRHDCHGVARGEVLARLLVVLLVEAPDKLLEDRAHAVVVEPLGTEINLRRGELLD